MPTAVAAPITVDFETTQRLAENYLQAWNDHDVDRILSMHAPTSAFHLHVAPTPEADTHAAMREQFAGLFSLMPDIALTTIRLEVRPGLFTLEWLAQATLAGPWQIGSFTAQPSGRRFGFRGVDVISCNQGLVRRKDCYLDTVGLQLALAPSR